MQQAELTGSTALYSVADVELLAIEPGKVDEVWYIAAKQLEPALDLTPKATLDSVRARLESGDAQLWFAWVRSSGDIICSCVSEIRKWESGFKTVAVLLIGGSRMDLWRHMILQMEQYAVAEGANALEVIGRPGWERVFEDYRKTETTIMKELGDDRR